MKPQDDATVFRVTMNTMTDPELYGLTLALGNSEAPREAPFAANTVMPAERFVTVHGTHGTVTDAATGEATPDAPAVAVDTVRRQVEISVPTTARDPQGNQRVAAAAGLWDRAGDKYLVPQVGAPLATDWLGDQPRAVDPPHVTYVRNPLMDDPESGLVATRRTGCPGSRAGTRRRWVRSTS